MFLDSLFTRSRVLHVTERLLKSMAVAAMMGFKNPAAATGMLMVDCIGETGTFLVIAGVEFGVILPDADGV